MRHHLTLRQKLLGCFGALAVMAALGVGSVPWLANTLTGELDRVATGPARKLDKMGEIILSADTARISGRNILVYSLIKEETVLKTEIGKYEVASKQTLALLAEMRPTMTTEAEREAFQRMDTNMTTWFSITGKVNAMATGGNAAEAAAFAQKNARQFSQASDKAKTELLQMQRQVMEAEGLKMHSYRRWAFTASVAGTLLALLVGVVVLMVVAGFDRDLRTATRELAAGAEQMFSASAQITSASQSVARISSAQAAALEGTSSSAEEISSISRQNVDSANGASTLVATVFQHAQKGDGAIRDLTTSMREIAASSESISKILRVIDEIAFQTNILALNAAVEAARAGESGLGFAVVADEVRNLAHRSAQAAKDTAALVEDSLSKSKSGGHAVDQVTTVFREISGSTGMLKALIDTVSAGSREQASGMTEIAGAITGMDQALQATAASAQETASAINEMSAQAGAVQQVAVRLTQMVGAR